MHFDRLKPCPPNVRIDEEEHAPRNRAGRPADISVRVQTRGRDMQLVDADDMPPQIPEPVPAEPGPARLAPAEEPRPIDSARMEAPKRYPTRERRQTDFFGPYVTH